MDENARAQRLFNLLERICLEFNDNLTPEVYNSGFNMFFRGQYIGIQQAARVFGYRVIIKHYYDNVMFPIFYCGMSLSTDILFEREFKHDEYTAIPFDGKEALHNSK